MKPTKPTINRVIKEANKSITEVDLLIKSLTNINPLTLFDEDVDSEKIYNFPFAYTVAKHGFFCPCVVQKVYDNKVTLFETGEMYGEIHEVELHFLSHETKIELLQILLDRM